MNGTYVQMKFNIKHWKTAPGKERESHAFCAMCAVYLHTGSVMAIVKW